MSEDNENLPKKSVKPLHPVHAWKPVVAIIVFGVILLCIAFYEISAASSVIGAVVGK